MNFSSIENLIDDLKLGKMILLVDDEDRENEGDLVFAADFVTSEKINFLAHHARGLICLALAPEIVDRLELQLMVTDYENGSPHKTAFTVSIEAFEGISTGISTADRAHTIKVAADKNSTAQSIRSPGHIFPLKAKANGVLDRMGHTEASVDLMKLAGLQPAAVICEVMNDDGSMARLPDLVKYAAKYDLKIGKIEELVQHRKLALQKDLPDENSKKEICC